MATMGGTRAQKVPTRLVFAPATAAAITTATTPMTASNRNRERVFLVFMVISPVIKK